MKKETMFAVIGEVDESKVADAFVIASYKKKTLPSWIKWGAAAACLCLAVGVVSFSDIHKTSPGSGVPDAGGNLLDGIDPVIRSISVFPATEVIENVENATIESMTETEAYSMNGLGEYLPTQLPEGYSFESATLYETTMKNGSKYHMLRTTYSKIGESSLQNGSGEVAGNPQFFADNFVVFVMDYKPDTQKKLYPVSDVIEALLEEIEGQVIHISYGDIYVGISDMDLPVRDIMNVINSIG